MATARAASPGGDPVRPPGRVWQAVAVAAEGGGGDEGGVPDGTPDGPADGAGTGRER